MRRHKGGVVGGEYWWITANNLLDFRVFLKLFLYEAAHRRAIPPFGMLEITVKCQIALVKRF